MGTRDGGQADIFSDVTSGTSGSLMISRFSQYGPLDLLVEFTIQARAIILAPGGSAMMTGDNQRQHRPDDFQPRTVVVRDGDDIRRVLAAFWRVAPARGVSGLSICT